MEFLNKKVPVLFQIRIIVLVATRNILFFNNGNSLHDRKKKLTPQCLQFGIAVRVNHLEANFIQWLNLHSSFFNKNSVIFLIRSDYQKKWKMFNL